MAGRIRKYIGVLGLLLLAALWLQPGTQAQAKTFMTPYLVEQAHGKAPDVTAYVTGRENEKICSVFRNNRRRHHIDAVRRDRFL